jgi:hypothetical protein
MRTTAAGWFFHLLTARDLQGVFCVGVDRRARVRVLVLVWHHKLHLGHLLFLVPVVQIELMPMHFAVVDLVFMIVHVLPALYLAAPLRAMPLDSQCLPPSTLLLSGSLPLSSDSSR